jgi:hypothetical protein
MIIGVIHIGIVLSRARRIYFEIWLCFFRSDRSFDSTSRRFLDWHQAIVGHRDRLYCNISVDETGE